MISETNFKKHEGICERCGRCCKMKVRPPWDESQVVALGACPYLCSKTNECLNYEQRFILNPFCQTVAQAMVKGLMPDDCPYVRDFPGYRSVVNQWRKKDERDTSTQDTPSH